MRFLFGTTDYLGAGTDIIARSFIEQSAWYVFLLKIIFTAVTLGGGFKGGEIVPTLLSVLHLEASSLRYSDFLQAYVLHAAWLRYSAA